MAIALFYDIHGNLPALQAAFAAARSAGATEFVIGGDVVPGPMPNECLALLATLTPAPVCISGNGEREVLNLRSGGVAPKLPAAVIESLRWTADALEPQHAEWIASWPATLSRDGVFYCHATPGSDTRLFTRLTPDADVEPLFAGVREPLAVCGHTHMQFDRKIANLRIVNPGSVGMPFGAAGACWALLQAPGHVQLRRTGYDLVAAAERVRASAYPDAEVFAERSILHPPSEADMLAAFSAVPA
ncbi:MAG TPA: metallophosphoesterase family protein [Terriglobales bacterium]|nr:metallophosphoesterase family protein [Terriglobales bacterium]